MNEEIKTQIIELLSKLDGPSLVINASRDGQLHSCNNAKNDLLVTALLLTYAAELISEDETIETILQSAGLNVTPQNLLNSVETLLKIGKHSKER